MSDPATLPDTFWQDPARRRTFLWGIAGTGATGGATAYYWSIFRHREPHWKWGLVYTVRASCFGALFFGVRESILYQRQQAETIAGVKSYTFRDYDAILGSVAAGLLASGSYSFVTFGRQAALPGLLIGGVVAGVGQGTINWFRNLRRSYLYRNAQITTNPSTTSNVVPSPATTTTASSDCPPTSTAALTAHPDRTGSQPTDDDEDITVVVPDDVRDYQRYMGENLLGKRLWTWAKAFKVPIPSWFPLQRLSDEDHLKMLQRRVEDIDDEVAVIDEELVYLKKFYERECEIQQAKDTSPTSSSPPESKP